MKCLEILHLQTCGEIYEFTLFSFQILPVNIKSLAGSVATLANWLTAWAITMTASLMLNWSNGGLFLFPPLPSRMCFPLWHWILPCLFFFIRNLCYLCCCVYHGPHFRVLVGTGDQRKDTGGNRFLIPLTRHDLRYEKPPCASHASGPFSSWIQPLFLDVPSSVFIWMYIVQYEAVAEGKCVYIYLYMVRWIVAERTQPLHGLRRRAIHLLYSSAIICPVKYRAHVRILKQ